MRGTHCKSDVRTLLAEKSQITNFNYDTWKRRMCEEHRAAAEEWRNAETKSEHDIILETWSKVVRTSMTALLGSSVVRHHQRHAQPLPRIGAAPFQRLDHHR